VSGVETVILEAADYGGMGPEWGTIRIVNDEGAWYGTLSGVNMGTDTHMTGWLQGEGAYTGLSYYYESVMNGVTLDGTVVGIIYPGDPPPTE